MLPGQLRGLCRAVKPGATSLRKGLQRAGEYDNLDF